MIIYAQVTVVGDLPIGVDTFKHHKMGVKRLELYRHIPVLNTNPIPFQMFAEFPMKKICSMRFPQ